MTTKTHVVAVDAGNGGVNALLHRSRGKPVQHYEPSIRAAATGASLGVGEFEMDYSYVDWNGARYVTGDDALKVARRNITRHLGRFRYGDEFHRFLVAVAIARLGIKSGDVNLTLFAPPGVFADVRDRIKEGFKDDVEIMLKGDKSPRQWRYSNVNVWPEGLAASLCFVLDDNGQQVGGDVLAGDVLILDSGVYTLDAVALHNGNFNPETLDSATFENFGIDRQVRQPLLHYLKEEVPEFVGLTVDDIDRVLRNGFVSGDFTLSHAGKSVDIAPLIEDYRLRFAQDIANAVIDSRFDQLADYRALIVVGGGAALIEDHLRKMYGPEKVLDRRKHASTKKLHPVDMNAIGGLRLALMRGAKG